MAYTKTTWIERIAATANKFIKTNETAGSVELVNDPGTITQAGTPFSTANMNNIEDGIEQIGDSSDFEAANDGTDASPTSELGLSGKYVRDNPLNVDGLNIPGLSNNLSNISYGSGTISVSTTLGWFRIMTFGANVPPLSGTIYLTVQNRACSFDFTWDGDAVYPQIQPLSGATENGVTMYAGISFTPSTPTSASWLSIGIDWASSTDINIRYLVVLHGNSSTSIKALSTPLSGQSTPGYYERLGSIGSLSDFTEGNAGTATTLQNRILAELGLFLKNNNVNIGAITTDQTSNMTTIIFNNGTVDSPGMIFKTLGYTDNILDCKYGIITVSKDFQSLGEIKAGDNITLDNSTADSPGLYMLNSGYSSAYIDRFNGRFRIADSVSGEVWSVDSTTGLMKTKDVNISGDNEITGTLKCNTIEHLTATQLTLGFTSASIFIGNSTNIVVVRNDIDVYGDLDVYGALSKGSGSFKIDHPLKPDTHNLVHSFVESPQANNIYRGKITLDSGKAEINIDKVSGMSEGTFTALNRDIHVYTTNETGWTMVRGKVDGNILTIESKEPCTDTISWLVIGERQDKHIKEAGWTDIDGRVIVEPLKEVK